MLKIGPQFGGEIYLFFYNKYTHWICKAQFVGILAVIKKNSRGNLDYLR